MAVGPGAQARALPCMLPWNVVGFPGNGHCLPPQVPSFFCLACGILSLSRPLLPSDSPSLQHPLGAELQEEGSVLHACVFRSQWGLAAQNASLPEWWRGSGGEPVFTEQSFPEVSWTVGRPDLWL